MRVLVYPADMAGCGYYRLLFAAEHLRSLGHDIIIQGADNESGFQIHWVGNKIVDFEFPFEDIDVLVMQRISHDFHLQALPLIRSRGIATVVDMDDDLSNIHPTHGAYWNYHRKSSSPFSWKNIEDVCKGATLVTVSTNSLLGIYAKHGRGQVIDNYIPERYLDIFPTRGPKPVFGWGGAVVSHPADLSALGRAIPTLVDQGHKFKVVGPDFKVQELLKLKEMPECTGQIPLQQWAAAISQLDVGLAPLEMSKFNTSKSRLKLLELNSVGVPYVASPRQEYRKYHRDSGGGGLLAETPKEWISAVNKLMKDEVLRKELGQRGQEYAESQTVEKNSWRWLEAWTRAYEMEKAAR